MVWKWGGEERDRNKKDKKMEERKKKWKMLLEKKEWV